MEIKVEKLASLQIDHIKKKLDEGYYLIFTEADYEDLPDEIKNHKNVKVNRPLRGDYIKWNIKEMRGIK